MISAKIAGGIWQSKTIEHVRYDADVPVRRLARVGEADQVAKSQLVPFGEGRLKKDSTCFGS
jgi:hypothetical protein